MEEAKEGLISRLRLGVGGWGLGVLFPLWKKGGLKQQIRLESRTTGAGAGAGAGGRGRARTRAKTRTATPLAKKQRRSATCWTCWYI